MAAPQTASWKKMTIWLGDGASPENFVKPCALTTKRFTQTKELTEQVVPDCDDDDLVPATERDVRSISASFAGSGVLAFESRDEWQDFFESDESRNVRIVLDHNLGGYYQGKFHLSQMEFNGNEGDGKITLAVEGASDGRWTWQDAT